MKYRTICDTMPEVSILGFGCMRFYRKDGTLDLMSSDKPVDTNLVDTLINTALERGINYFDTAYTYLGGMSESILGSILQGHKRQQSFIATKLPAWKVKETDDFERFLHEQLKRLQTDCIDYYLVHSLSGKTWKQVYDLGILPFLDAIKKAGKVRAIGFSFHDLYSSFEPILDAYPWDFCQIQYNYLDTQYQAGRKGLLKAHEKGVGVISMEPLLGGKLATQLPTEAVSLLQKKNPDMTPAEWALRWVWNHPQIALLLSGMNQLDQLNENCTIADSADVAAMSKEEMVTIQEVKQIFDERIKVHCSGCAYCMPCPHGVNIPRVFALYNEAYRFDNPESAVWQYNSMPTEKRASACVACNECLSKCPHQLPISALMKDISDTFKS